MTDAALCSNKAFGSICIEGPQLLTLHYHHTCCGVQFIAQTPTPAQPVPFESCPPRIG